jgi:tetratricopeptide (TPR) repeat protein
LQEQALAAVREAGDRRIETNTLSNLGLLHLTLGRTDEARTELATALAMAQDMGHMRIRSTVLCNLGMVATAIGLRDEARRRFDGALTTAREQDDHRSEGQVLGYLAVLEAHEARFEDARRCLDAGAALLRAFDDPYSLALLECNRAEVEHLADAPDASASALDEAQSLAGRIGASAQSELGLAIARVLTLQANRHA